MTQQEVLAKLETDIELRAMSPYTVNEYTDKTRVFMWHVDQSADKMGETEFRGFLEYLNQKKQLVQASIKTYNSVLRFLVKVTLEQNLNYKRLSRKNAPSKCRRHCLETKFFDSLRQ